MNLTTDLKNMLSQGSFLTQVNILMKFTSKLSMVTIYTFFSPLNFVSFDSAVCKELHENVNSRSAISSFFTGFWWSFSLGCLPTAIMMWVFSLGCRILRQKYPKAKMSPNIRLYRQRVWKGKAVNWNKGYANERRCTIFTYQCLPLRSFCVY